MKTCITKMMCLDIFLNSLPENIYRETKKSLKQDNSEVTRLIMSADLYLPHLSSLLKNADTSKDISILNTLAKDFKWSNNIDTILKENVFESLVITDKTKNIVWVNDGFVKMTGYSKKYAVNKTPKFLQGKESLTKANSLINAKLKNGKQFKAVVVNYKKDNTSYKCELNIFPLYNLEKKVTHYLALERQIA